MGPGAQRLSGYRVTRGRRPNAARAAPILFRVRVGAGRAMGHVHRGARRHVTKHFRGKPHQRPAAVPVGTHVPGARGPRDFGKETEGSPTL